MSTVESIVEKYIQFAQAHREGLNNGDHRRANRAYRSITGLYRKMEKDPRLAESVLPHLMNHSDDAVSSWAAVHALGLGLQMQTAEGILMNIAQDDTKGLLGFSARMALLEWQKKGILKF